MCFAGETDVLLVHFMEFEDLSSYLTCFEVLLDRASRSILFGEFAN